MVIRLEKNEVDNNFKQGGMQFLSILLFVGLDLFILNFWIHVYCVIDDLVFTIRCLYVCVCRAMLSFLIPEEIKV